MHHVNYFRFNLGTACITHLGRLRITIRVLLCILKGFLLPLGTFFLWASFKEILQKHVCNSSLVFKHTSISIERVN